MAIVWIDGFDHYSAANGARKFTLNSSVSMTTARYGSGQAIFMNSAATGLIKVLPTSSQAWRFGFAYQITSFANEPVIIGLQNGGTAQVELRLNVGQKLRVTRNTTQIGVSNKALNWNVWYYIEWYIVISDSIGSNQCIVKVNGEEWINLDPGTDTQNDTVSTADRFYSTSASSTTQVFDDLVVWQDAVTTSPTFAGDLRVVTLYPDGTGTYGTIFVGSDGNTTNNYQLVDETLVDDTDYVLGNTVGGTKDSYTFGNPTSTPASVAAIQLVSSAKKDDIGNCNGKLFLRVSSTDYESTATQLTTSYAFYTNVWETNPNTAGAWNSTTLNALEGGPSVS